MLSCNVTTASTLPISESIAFFTSALEVMVTACQAMPRFSASALASLLRASELVSPEL